MKENKKKTSREKKVLIGALSLAAVTMASSTFAWFTSKDEVTNRLSANADYNVRIVESFAAPNNWLPGNVTNKDVYATNTGNIPAFVKEEVSGVLTITTEKSTDKVTSFGTAVLKDSYLKLTPEEVYVMEAGAFLAYKPETDTINTLGDQIVLVTKEVDPNNTESFETKTDFNPASEGVYIFRRSIVVESDESNIDTYRTETFTYEGYYFKDGNYYKINNLNVNPDTNPDRADDSRRDDGYIKDGSFYFCELEQKVISPVDLKYEPAFAGQAADVANNIPEIEAHPQRLIATYDTSILADTTGPLADAASRLDTAIHNYEYALELVKQAQSENTTASSNLEAAKRAYDDAYNAWLAASKDCDEKESNYKALKAISDDAKSKMDAAELAYKGWNDAESLDKAQSEYDKAVLAAGTVTDDDRTRFVSELKDFLNRDDVSNVTVAELKSFVASTEKHDYNEKQADLLIKKIALDDAKAKETELSNNKIMLTEAYNTALGKTNVARIAFEGEDENGGAKKRREDAKIALEGTDGNGGAKKELEDALKESNGNDESNGTNKELKDALDKLAIATAEKNNAQIAYDLAKKNADDNGSGTSVLTIYINLSNDVTLTGGEADKWQMLPATVENNTAVFYYTGILLGSETSSKLIDSVELAETVTTDMYKSFDFDLNIKLDSAQITYAEDNETILATAPNEQFDVKDELGTTIKDVTATLSTPTDLETAVNWTIS